MTAMTIGHNGGPLPDDMHVSMDPRWISGLLDLRDDDEISSVARVVGIEIRLQTNLTTLTGYFSINRLEQRLPFGHKRIAAAIKELEARGHIKVTQRKTKAVTHYRVEMEIARAIEILGLKNFGPGTEDDPQPSVQEPKVRHSGSSVPEPKSVSILGPTTEVLRKDNTKLRSQDRQREEEDKQQQQLEVPSAVAAAGVNVTVQNFVSTGSGNPGPGYQDPGYQDPNAHKNPEPVTPELAKQIARAMQMQLGVTPLQGVDEMTATAMAMDFMVWFKLEPQRAIMKVCGDGQMHGTRALYDTWSGAQTAQRPAGWYNKVIGNKAKENGRSHLEAGPRISAAPQLGTAEDTKRRTGYQGFRR